MEAKSNNKKNHVILILLCVVVVALVITVFLQNKRINTLNKERNKITLAEDTQSEPKTDNISLEKSMPPEDDSMYIDKIKEPEFKIDDTQARQYNLEETHEKAEEESNTAEQVKPKENLFEMLSSEMMKNPAMENMMRNQAKTRILSSYDSFAQENNLSPEIKTRLIDLLVEKQMEAVDIASQIGNLGKDYTREDLKQETDYVNKLYDEKISELLSPEEFAAYKDYEEVQPEREFLTQFKTNLQNSDIQLNKQQEKELIGAMYNERLKFDEILEERQQMISNENPFSKENLIKSLELQKEIYSGYLESSRGVLSEPQREKFGEFIDYQRSILDMSAEMGPRILGIPDNEETTQ